jgi:hypothetical protein
MFFMPVRVGPLRGELVIDNQDVERFIESASERPSGGERHREFMNLICRCLKAIEGELLEPAVTAYLVAWSFWIDRSGSAEDLDQLIDKLLDHPDNHYQDLDRVLYPESAFR